MLFSATVWAGVWGGADTRDTHTGHTHRTHTGHTLDTHRTHTGHTQDTHTHTLSQERARECCIYSLATYPLKSARSWRVCCAWIKNENQPKEEVFGAACLQNETAPEKLQIDTKNGLKNAKKDPKNDPKRDRKKFSPSQAA